MKFVVVSGNPKKDGLTKRMTDEIIRGVKDGGADACEVSAYGMSYCRSCNGGAGQCLGDSHRCVFGKDGFTDAQEKIREADAVAFITPVYWEEVSEGLKSFMDRFRRCESSGIFNQRQAALTGKTPSEMKTVLVARALGENRGTSKLTVAEMDRVIDYVKRTIKMFEEAMK